MPSNYPYQYQVCLDMEQMEEPHVSLEGFKPLTILMEILGAVLIIMVAVWCGYHRGGFSWRSNPDLEFNWHPLLMIIGFVFLYANGMLLYRTQRNARKRRLKLIHGGIMLFVVVLVVIALVAVFDSHNLKAEPIPNMYSLHSWIGLTSVILFCCQWLAGFLSFLYPGIQLPLRASYMPIHVYFGIAGFIGVIASCLLGLNEKAFFILKNDYSKLGEEAVLINVIGLLLILFGGVTVYLVTQERYKRFPKPEDESLVSGRSQ
ncbi:transmembrane ascorbate-dependent reductase CYB561-like isoform X1 [Hylaeus anthracinus]|uniref:transmembrane ascorbate-dependent reductase CYB561-like isoform X1 n=2 Tax=Hylaeus anthracinus TaxID=313031 RepID=UPI0023B9D818|nr:transmembrane ascorbate-dependent reductase CYB561-like isoform X1 [Hylaeus anthracinus]